MSNQIDQIMNIINEQPEVNDQFVGGEELSNKPVEVSREEINAQLQKISKEEQDTKFFNTNNIEVFALCAKGPHAAKYVKETMGITTLECDTNIQGFQGKELPVKVPEKASYPWDGYAFRYPDGKEVYVRSTRVIDWLLDNTFGKVLGGNSKRALEVKEAKSKNLNQKRAPLKVKRYGLSAYNEDDILITYEEDRDEDGSLKTVSRKIPLEGGETAVDEAGKKLALRGTVSNFPVFRRKAEYADQLGQIGGGRGGREIGPITGEYDRQEAFEEYLRLIALKEKSETI